MNIDFVIAWVDGSDVEWQRKMKSFNNCEGDGRDERYRDWNYLKYWLRGVEKYAPWVNRIFLITDKQKPGWLIEKEPLTIVDHTDFIPEKYLPTFNSHTIELNIHRIPGLSEHFVYFNDDMLLTNYVKETDYFINGLPCDYAVESPITANELDIFNNILMNNMILLNRNHSRKSVLKEQKSKMHSPKYIKGMVSNLALSVLQRDDFFGFKYFHLSSRMKKETFRKMWDENYDWLNSTCLHKFRSASDVNQYVILNAQYVTGEYVPYNVDRYGKVFQLDDSENKNNIYQAVEAIQSGMYKEVCLNDSKITDFCGSKEIIESALLKLLPKKSRFEK